MTVNNVLASAYAWQGYNVAEEGIIEAAEHGFDYWYVDGSVHSDFVTEWSPDRIQGLRDLIVQYSVKPIFHGNFKAPLSSDVEAIRRTAVKYTLDEINLCAEIDAKLVIHGSSIVEPRMVSYTKSLCLDQYLKSIEELNAHAEKLGVDIVLENLPNYPHYRPFHYIFTLDKEFEYILDRVDNKLFCDLGHANVNAELSVEDLIKKYASRISAISISNNDGLKDQHYALHKGTIDYKKVVEIMIERKWRGIVAFETRAVLPSKSISDFSELCDEVVQSMSHEQVDI